jgi:hypothetical protein
MRPVRRPPSRLTLNDQRSQPATRQPVTTGGYWTILAGGTRAVVTLGSSGVRGQEPRSVPYRDLDKTNESRFPQLGNLRDRR